MRDQASEVYRVEPGKPFTATRGSQVARNGVTASQIAARDFLAARNRQRNEEHAPTGPMVVVSGGQVWHDHEMLWDILDDIKARVPEMVLATTGMRKGVDAIATSWAQSRKVKAISFIPNRAHGNRAPFLRNENLVKLRPIEAIVCEGSGIQSNLAQRLRQAGVPAAHPPPHRPTRRTVHPAGISAHREARASARASLLLFAALQRGSGASSPVAAIARCPPGRSLPPRRGVGKGISLVVPVCRPRRTVSRTAGSHHFPAENRYPYRRSRGRCAVL